MATLVAYQNGNINGTTTFKGVLTGTAALQTTISASTNTTTSNVGSSAFTTANNEVIEGVLCYCNRVNTTGTVDVIFSADGTTETRKVTVNASDLPSDPSWVFFKFGSTYTTANAATNKILIKGSSAGNATFFRDATAGNWARILRNATTATPAAADILYMADEWTAASTKTDIDVTVNAFLSTAYGNIFVGYGSILKFDETTDIPRLYLAGSITITGGGTLQLGTSASPLTKAGVGIFFNSSLNPSYIISVQNGATFNCYGSGGGRTNTWAKLNADAAANATSVTTDISTSWTNNDLLVFTPTGISATQAEFITVSGAASGTTVNLKLGGGAGGGLLYSHNGTAPMQGEILNTTTTVLIRGNASNQTFGIDVAATGIFNCEWTTFQYINRCLLSTTTGSVYIKYCSFYLIGDSATAFTSQGVMTGSGSVYLGYSNFYGGSTSQTAVSISANSYVGVTVTNCCVTRCQVSYALLTGGLTFTNNAASASTSVSGGCITANSNPQLLETGTFSNITVHTTGGTGISFGPWNGTLWSNITVYHTNLQSSTGSAGISINPGASSSIGRYNFDTVTSIGNNYANINLGGGINSLDAKTVTLCGTSSVSTPRGIRATQSYGLMTIRDSTFGLTTAHSTADVEFTSVDSSFANMIFQNCNFASTTEFSNIIYLIEGQYIGSQKHDQTAGLHKSYNREGNGSSDTTIYKTASPSERLTPNFSTLKLTSGRKKVAIANATTKTINVWVRKSAVGDGTAYNGNQPRLRYRFNSGAGISSEGTLATMSASTGTWQQLTGTSPAVTDDAILEFYVDCDGTAGWINIDDWTVS